MIDLENILKAGISIATTIGQSSVGMFCGRVVTYAASYPIPATIAVVTIAAIIFKLYSYHVSVKEASITNKIIDDWIKSSGIDEKNGKKVKERILFFLNNETKSELSLGGCSLKSLPNIFHLRQFKRLKDLNLSYNQLEKLPKEIGKLSSLKKLSLQINNLTELPKEIGNLCALETLYLERNKLSLLPLEIGNLSSLEMLDLSSNKLESLPKEIGNLGSLKRLDLVANNLEILLPEIGNLGSLVSLSLGHNYLKLLPKEIGKLDLHWLEIKNNNLESLPKEIDNLSSLKSLDLSSNKLESLPKEIGNLGSLKSLDLGSNNLESLPKEIGNLSSLKSLDLGSNNLESLPKEIGNLNALKRLILDNNRLRLLPLEIGNLSSLKELDIRYNQELTNLPNEIFRLRVECEVDIAGCSLSENILSNLREATSAEDYHGPTFLFSMAYANPNYQLKSAEDSLKALYKAIGEPYKPLTMPESPELKSWLSKLDWMSDYNASPEIKKWLAINILGYLALAEENEPFREIFNFNIKEAIKSCGDRMALSVVRLGIAKKIATIDTSDLKNLAEFLKQGVFAVSLVEKSALKKSKTLKLVDEIEVHLAYLVKLKERLGLPIDIQGMLFFDISGVTEKDLEDAFLEVSQEINDENAFYKFLSSEGTWLKALQQKSPEKYAKAKNPELEIDDEHPDYWTVLPLKINEGLIALTKEALTVT